MADDFFKINLTVDERQMQRAVKFFAQFPDKMPYMMADALNRSIGKARTEIVSGITKRYLINKAEVLKHLRITDATRSKLQARMSIKSEWSFPLSRFKVSPAGVQRPRRPRAGLRVQVLRGTGGKRLPRAFMEEMKSGHIGVFERTGDPRRPPIKNAVGDKKKVTPIKQLFSPSVATMATNPTLVKQAEDAAFAMLEKRMNHAIDIMEKQLLR